MPQNIPVGRTEILRRLSPLPTVSLIKAPASTGKRTVAVYLADQAGVHRADQRLWPQPYWADERGRPSDPSWKQSESLKFVEPELSVEMAREIIAWSRTAPHTPAGRVAFIRLDHERADGSVWSASARCVTALLKTLEEPPPMARFVLLASGFVPATVVSRAVTVSAGLLTTEQLAEILYRVSDLDKVAAKDAATAGSGRVASSLAVASSTVGVREVVMGLLADLSSRDTEASAARAREWTSAATALLVRASHEKLTGRYVVFTAEELSSLTLPWAMRVLRVVRGCSGTRPRLLVGALVAALT